MDSDPSKFNAKLEKLSSIIEQLEQNNLPIEDSLKLFEEGVQLTQQAQKTIAKADQRVQMLLNSNDDPLTEDNLKADENER